MLLRAMQKKLYSQLALIFALSFAPQWVFISRITDPYDQSQPSVAKSEQRVNSRKLKGHSEDPIRFDLFQRQVLEPGVKLRSFVSESWLYMLKASPAVRYSIVTF